MPTRSYGKIAEQITGISSSSSTFSSAATSWTDVTGLSLSFTGTGRILKFRFVQDGSANAAWVYHGGPTTNVTQFRVLRDAAVINWFREFVNDYRSPSMFNFDFAAPAGQYTYKLQLNNTSANAVQIYYTKMKITEI